jgi:hypothetical protein
MSEPLKEFAIWVIENSAFIGCDLDGCDVQEKAVELGLLVETQYHPIKHGSHAICEPGDTWFDFSELLAGGSDMGTKNNPGTFDCYKDAEPDEPMFVLLVRDPIAPPLVRQWAERRRLTHGHSAKVKEAIACANAMEEWRAKR